MKRLSWGRLLQWETWLNLIISVHAHVYCVHCVHAYILFRLVSAALNKVQCFHWLDMFPKPITKIPSEPPERFGCCYSARATVRSYSRPAGTWLASLNLLTLDLQPHQAHWCDTKLEDHKETGSRPAASVPATSEPPRKPLRTNMNQQSGLRPLSMEMAKSLHAVVLQVRTSLGKGWGWTDTRVPCVTMAETSWWPKPVSASRNSVLLQLCTSFHI